MAWDKYINLANLDVTANCYYLELEGVCKGRKAHASTEHIPDDSHDIWIEPYSNEPFRYFISRRQLAPASLHFMVRLNVQRKIFFKKTKNHRISNISCPSGFMAYQEGIKEVRFWTLTALHSAKDFISYIILGSEITFWDEQLKDGTELQTWCYSQHWKG